MIKNFLNPDGLQNPMSGSKVMAILLKGLILPIGGVASGKEASGQRLISLKSKTKRVKKNCPRKRRRIKEQFFTIICFTFSYII